MEQKPKDGSEWKHSIRGYYVPYTEFPPPGTHKVATQI